ncbi:MAG: serine/threonine protein kinase, partial [Acidobacteriota bacterium]|nr:serine/threonine protein kinase [Acidobacteriota bacterium]
MLRCPSCSGEISEATGVCGSCGVAAALKRDRDMADTELLAGQAPTVGTIAVFPSSNPDSSDSQDEGRFLPGSLIADRYRIAGLIGRGGMGEVYRAHDLKLAQQVALKFLPQETAADETTRARFYNEVRMARQVSHPHVCRVFDIGEANGQPYISMEYVDGEDLRALLRRIGRLPNEKALEIAHKLCAGLAAAHDRGVLHRDLKPANIMIDDRGQVLIMDFGLAGIVNHIPGSDVRFGTPAYMAPEQLEGKEVSVQSDIYALGLVLYEVFTGQIAFQGATLQETLQLRKGRARPTLAALARDMDPEVARVVLRCLETEPRSRPSSALSIAAALPGGDPLAAALAAGQTPSPELVAAARSVGGLQPMPALACLVFIAAGLAALPFLNDKTNWIAQTPLEYSPDTLAHQAAGVIERLGYASKSLDRAFGLSYDYDYLEFLDQHKNAPAESPPIRFWYRTSQQYLAADRFLSAGVISWGDPPALVSGMMQVQLDPRGRLVYFETIPPQVETARQPGAALPASPDWKPLFAAAGLDLSLFTPADPKWLPLTTTDVRMAWNGSYPNGAPGSLRVEAASWHGKPVYLQLIQPWTRPERMTSLRATPAQTAGYVLLLLFGSAILVGAGVLARHNTQLGREDRRSAGRLATLIFALTLGNWALSTHHSPSNAELSLIALGLSQALLVGTVVWVLYVGLEPYVRRRWPHTMISWSRMMDGRFKDALVGNRLLAGITAGVAVPLLLKLMLVLQMRSGAHPSPYVVLSTLMGGPQVLSYLLGSLPVSLSTALSQFFLFFLLRALLRKEWLAGVMFVVIDTAFTTLYGPSYTAWAIPFRLAEYTLMVLVMMRFGLASLVMMVAVAAVLLNFPITADLSAWYSNSGLFALALIGGLSTYAFHT